MIPLPTPVWAREHHGETDVYVEEDMLAYGDAKATERQELICNRISDALSSDLENGVKRLNAIAADEFRKNYPALYKLIKELNG